MSKKKKHKKNKKSHGEHMSHTQTTPVADQSENLNENKEAVKLLEREEELTKIENKPVDLLAGDNVSATVVETKLDNGTEVSTADAVLEVKEEAEKVNDRIATSPTNDSETATAPNNFVPFWVGIVVGAVLMYLFL